jgi:hypothetical protein
MGEKGRQQCSGMRHEVSKLWSGQLALLNAALIKGLDLDALSGEYLYGGGRRCPALVALTSAAITTLIDLPPRIHPLKLKSISQLPRETLT